jgi:hypothetical protein
MANKFYMLVLVLLGLAVKWLEDDAYADGARDKQEAWLDGFQRGVKSVETGDAVLR